MIFNEIMLSCILDAGWWTSNPLHDSSIPSLKVPVITNGIYCCRLMKYLMWSLHPTPPNLLKWGDDSFDQPDSIFVEFLSSCHPPSHPWIHGWFRYASSESSPFTDGGCGCQCVDSPIYLYCNPKLTHPYLLHMHGNVPIYLHYGIWWVWSIKAAVCSLTFSILPRRCK